MELTARPDGEGKVEVTVPPLRSDILHECDIVGECPHTAPHVCTHAPALTRFAAEDVAIAYGFNNITTRMPSAPTEGRQQPINKLCVSGGARIPCPSSCSPLTLCSPPPPPFHSSDLLRHEIAHAGYTEVLTLGLCSREENYAMLNHEEDGLAVSLANPKTVEYQVARTRLLPGMLKTVRENRQRSVREGMKVRPQAGASLLRAAPCCVGVGHPPRLPPPVQLFEISDVVLKDEANDVGARNERRICAAYMGPTAGFEVVHGLVDRIMQLLEVKSRVVSGTSERHYFIEAHQGALAPPPYHRCPRPPLHTLVRALAQTRRSSTGVARASWCATLRRRRRPGGGGRSASSASSTPPC